MHRSSFLVKTKQVKLGKPWGWKRFSFVGAHACRGSTANMHQYFFPMHSVTVHPDHLATFRIRSQCLLFHCYFEFTLCRRIFIRGVNDHFNQKIIGRNRRNKDKTVHLFLETGKSSVQFCLSRHHNIDWHNFSSFDAEDGRHACGNIWNRWFKQIEQTFCVCSRAYLDINQYMIYLKSMRFTYISTWSDTLEVIWIVNQYSCLNQICIVI